MELSRHQKQLLLITFIFILIRVPILFIQLKLMVIGKLMEGINSGLVLYCDFDKFPLGSYWFDHAFPPGTYVFAIILFYFQRFGFIVLIEFINMVLIYKIISRYYGQENAKNGLIFIAFFPISIINSGFTLDPFQISLNFILLGMLLFFNDKPLLSAICLGIGTLIIYIPAIVIVPICFYYLKSEQHNILDIIKYLIVFITTIILGCLPFLIMCPDIFISSIFSSLNTPHSGNFLGWEEFTLTQLLTINIFEFEFSGALISIKVLNLVQVGVLFVAFYLIYNKFQFKDERDIIYSTVILFSIISIITFYIHFRFIYWIFMLSLILLSFSSFDFFEKNIIILFGFIFFLFSFVGSIVAVQNASIDNILIRFLEVFILVFILTACFLALGLLILYGRNTKGDNLHYGILYSSILIFCFFFYQFFIEVYLVIGSIFLLNLGLILILVIEIGILLVFISKPLKKGIKRGKIVSLMNQS